MPTQPSSDPIKAARGVLDVVIGKAEPAAQGTEPEKNPAAVLLGRLGGLKGGKARAAKLSKKALVASAKKAAKARWSKKKA